MAVSVRVAEPDDLGRVGSLTVAAYHAAGLVPAHSDYADALADAPGRARDAELLVATDGTMILGSVTFCRAGTAYAEISQPGEAEFRMLAVDPDARGRGVGATLVRACLDRAAAIGATALVLSTPEKATAAQGLYGRLGFARMPERDWSPIPGVSLLAYTIRPPAIRP